MSPDVLTLAVEQFTPRLRDPAANLAHIVGAAGNADVLLTPELSLTGYDVGDAAHHLATPLRVGEPLPHGSCDVATALVLGLIERGHDGVPYNAAALVQQKRVRFRHRKIYLPTYGMFDEARFFGRGSTIAPTELNGWSVGILVCEDFWHPGLIYTLAAAGIDLLLVQAAAPGRGVWDGGDGDSPFASGATWEGIARTTARLYGIYVALANRTGVEGAVTFAGGSLVAAPTGDIIARAGPTPTRIEVELRRSDLMAARRPYAHARDDDPQLVRRALERLDPG